MNELEGYLPLSTDTINLRDQPSSSSASETAAKTTAELNYQNPSGYVLHINHQLRWSNNLLTSILRADKIRIS